MLHYKDNGSIKNEKKNYLENDGRNDESFHIKEGIFSKSNSTTKKISPIKQTNEYNNVQLNNEASSNFRSERNGARRE